MKKIALIILIFASFIACDETDTNTKAKAITYEEILADINYSWFADAYNNYTPNDSISDLIKENYNEGDDSFLIFASLACGCGGEIEFAKYLKVLKEAGIESTLIYGMAEPDYTHPYQDKITLTQLPSFFKLTNGMFVYSIVDSLNNFKDINNPEAEITDSSAVIEQAILDALTK
jgi:hypothetical protein